LNFISDYCPNEVVTKFFIQFLSLISLFVWLSLALDPLLYHNQLYFSIKIASMIAVHLKDSKVA